MEFITLLLANKAAFWSISALIALIVGYIIKGIPTNKIYETVEGFAYILGKIVTKTLASNKYIGKAYEATIEPWLILIVHNVLAAFGDGLQRGLEFDNKPEKMTISPVKRIFARKKHVVK